MIYTINNYNEAHVELPRDEAKWKSISAAGSLKAFFFY